jgi:hypothetical protein
LVFSRDRYLALLYSLSFDDKLDREIAKEGGYVDKFTHIRQVKKLRFSGF